MLMTVIQMRPFLLKSTNSKEIACEGVIMIVTYHLVLLSDFVPIHFKEFRDAIGYSMISVILTTVLVLIFTILHPFSAKAYVKL